MLMIYDSLNSASSGFLEIALQRGKRFWILSDFGDTI